MRNEMEPRIEKEREYFNKQASEKKGNLDKLISSEKLNPYIGIPYVFCEGMLRKYCPDKKVLDYGCGLGKYSVFIARNGGEVTGIDISDVSLGIARERAIHEGVSGQTSFVVMDCEAMDFTDNSFDIVFNSGVLSYLNLQKAMSEIVRVLKPGGTFLGIDTLGHNPLLNLNRKIKQQRNLRSQWVVDHILRRSDLQTMKQHFYQADFWFFNLATLAAVPFARLAELNFLLNALKAVDATLLKLPLFQNWAFKVVFQLSSPNKSLPE